MLNHLPTGKFWDRAWSLIEGCTPVSPGCDHCWLAAGAHMRARNPNAKISQANQGLTTGGCFNGTIRLRPDRLDLPLKTKKPTVWAIWSDLGHEAVPDSFRHEAFSIMEDAPQHIFLIITKRPENFGNVDLKYEDDPPETLWPPNIWLITTVENQEQADLRLPLARQIPAAVLGILHEPALGPVDWRPFLPLLLTENRKQKTENRLFHWLIAGGETGPHARPAHPDWFRQDRDQAQAAGVPFFFKHNGEFTHIRSFETFQKWVQKAQTWVHKGDICLDLAGRVCKMGKNFEEALYPVAIMRRVGKKAAGRTLDGRTWDEVPS